jgi:hypothetical protein
VDGRSPDSAPGLPAPSGTVVNVSTEAQLQSAVQHLTSNMTIVLAPGTYVLSSTVYINGTFTNVAIRGATNKRDDVVLRGAGMANASYGNVPMGIWTGGNVSGVLIANLTIRDVYTHPINFNAGTQSPRVYNVHLIDAGEQFIKSNPDSAGNGVNDGTVEYSVMEYTSTAPSTYTNGVDVHAGSGWVIRHNVFRNLVGPAGQLAGPAVLMWNHASGTITEGNTFINCSRGIAYGLQDVTGADHSGGIIRNNFVFRAANQPGDAGIGVYDSPNTQVLNNTVYLSGTYDSAIEYRFPQTTGVVIANNLTDGSIWARDGAAATLTRNVTGAGAAVFVNAAGGDLHLASTAAPAIDHGVTLSAVTDDWDGDGRPQGPACDIGADERNSGGAPVPPISGEPAGALDTPQNGSSLREPFVVAGWAIDRAASAGMGVDEVDVWAYPNPGSGAAPVFLGAATLGGSRPDVGSLFGSRFTSSGYGLQVNALGSGSYRLDVSAHSSVTGAFNALGSAWISVLAGSSSPHAWIDTPVEGATVGPSFLVAGWALDSGAPSGAGVDAIHVYAYPNPGSGTAPIFLGAADIGGSRGDVGGVFGSQFTSSGYGLLARNLGAGTYQLVVYARSTVTGLFTAAARNVSVRAPGNPTMSLDLPINGTTVHEPFVVAGWAVDLDAPTGTGIDAIHVWALPTDGRPAIFLGVGARGGSRPDVGSVFGAQFTSSGYGLIVSSLPPGSYQIVVSPHSSVSAVFSQARSVVVTVY